MPTLNQKRAAQALVCVNEIVDQPDQNLKDKYGSLARGFPAMIQINGLGPSLAFLLAKGKPQHLKLFDHLSNWLCQSIAPTENKAENNFLNWVIGKDTGTYQLATREAVQFSMWLKRFTEAKNLGDEQGETQ